MADALAAAKVTVDSNDKLSAAPSAALKDGATLRYTRVDVETKDQEAVGGVQDRAQGLEDLERGKTKVDVAGVTGVRTLTYRTSGTTARSSASSGSTVQGDQEAGDRGAAGRHQGAQPKPTRATQGTSTGGGNVSGGVWDRLAKCESGGNWSINTGNGYYGGLQFSLGTWRAYGGSGYPHQNSKAQQIAIGQEAAGRRGVGPVAGLLPQAGPSLSPSTSSGGPARPFGGS